MIEIDIDYTFFEVSRKQKFLVECIRKEHRLGEFSENGFSVQIGLR